MSYTPPSTFTINTPIQATDINANNDAARKYLNKGVASGDFASDKLGTTEVVKGEYYNVVPDHQFTTGDIYTQTTVSNDNGSNRQYYSDTLKTTLDSQWTHVAQYQVIADSGKSIYFEQNNGDDITVGKCAKIIITGHIGVRNYAQYIYDDLYFAGPQSTRFFLLYKAEGLTDAWTPVPDSVGQVLGFETYQNNVATVNGTAQFNDYRNIPFLYEVAIDNLWATTRTDKPKPQTLAYRFALGAETTIDLGWINNRVLIFEVFYA